MNCFEKLRHHTRRVCEPRIWNGKIIEFEDLPEEEKYNDNFYEKEKDLLLYCEKCKWNGIIEGDKEAQSLFLFNVYQL